MIVMVDSMPGIGKKTLLKELYIKNRSAFVFETNYLLLHPFMDVFCGHNPYKLSNAIIELESLIMSNLIGIINELYSVMNMESLIISELSIFWPYVWIETFKHFNYITLFERDTLIRMLDMVIIRFFHYIRENQFHLIYQFIHIIDQAEFTYNYTVAEDKCYRLQGLVFKTHPDFFQILFQYFVPMLEYVRSLAITSDCLKYIHIFQNNKFIYMEDGHKISIEHHTLAKTILENIQDIKKNNSSNMLDDEYAYGPDILLENLLNED